MFIRLSAIGDVVMATSVINVFRRAYPDSYITWLVESKAKDLLAENTLLDEVIVWHKAEWKELLKRGKIITLTKEISHLVRQLRRIPYDIAIDMQGLLKSAVFAYISGAKDRIGLGSKECSNILMTKVIPRRYDDKRISSQYLQLVESLGLEPGDFLMNIAISEKDEGFAENFKVKSNIERYAVICPFTTRPQKHWMEGRWSEFSDKILEDYNLPVIMLGGKGDIPASNRIESMCRKKIFNMSGKFTLMQSAALIKHSSLLIGVDTGITHMGIAFNIPTIAIFGSTCPYTDTRKKNTIILYKNMECSPCRRRPTCDGHFKCMEAITVEDVLRKVSYLLNDENFAR